jgi:hypothetical protein
MKSPTPAVHMRHPGAGCDNCFFSSDSVPFTNLHILHYAATTGDVSSIEKVVALGATIDFPVRDNNAPGILLLPALPGSTALLLAWVTLAVYSNLEGYQIIPRNEIAPLLESIDRICECAIRLVHPGVDCQVKLQIPAQRRNAQVETSLTPRPAYHHISRFTLVPSYN